MLLLQLDLDLGYDSSLTFNATVYNSFAVEIRRGLPDSDSTLGRHRVLLMLYIKEFRSSVRLSTCYYRREGATVVRKFDLNK
jgi:hypothetical protein